MFNKLTPSLQTQRKYEETMIVLMAVGPYRLHVFWEIDTKDIVVLEKQSGNNIQEFSYILRVYDISNIIFDGKNAHNHFDIEIDKDAENWYIDLWTAGYSYCVELGIKTDNRNFFPLVRSNYVNTPVAEPSILAGPRWMKVEMGYDGASLQHKRCTTDNVRTTPSVCNDGINAEKNSDINRGLIDYKVSPKQRDMIITLAKDWPQGKDRFTSLELQYFTKYINEILNDPKHNSALCIPCEMSKNRQNFGPSSITAMAK